MTSCWCDALWTKSLSASLSGTRQHRVDPGDESVELRHVTAKKSFADRVVGDFALVSDQSWGELNVRLDRIHQRRVAKRHDAAKVLLADGGSDLPRRRADDPRRLAGDEFVPYGRLAQSIAFLRPPGIERLYSGVTNSTASTAAIASLRALRHRRIVSVVVVAVQREIRKRNLAQMQLLWGKSYSARDSFRLIDALARLPTRYPTL